MTTGLRSDDLESRFPTTWRAIGYACDQHAGQRRKGDGAPFILHPLEVGALLHRAGEADSVIAAGVLHDTIEKSDATAAALRDRFGPAVATIVLAVTEDDRLGDYAERKAGLRRQVAIAETDAVIVFAADKLSKARELTRALRGGGSDGQESVSAARRTEHYVRCLQLAQRRLGDVWLIAELRSEVEKLRSTLHDQVVASAV